MDRLEGLYVKRKVYLGWDVFKIAPLRVYKKIAEVIFLGL